MSTTNASRKSQHATSGAPLARTSAHGSRLAALAFASILALGGVAGTALAAGGDGTGPLGTGPRGGRACGAESASQQLSAPSTGSAPAAKEAWDCPRHAGQCIDKSTCHVDLDGDGICDTCALPSCTGFVDANGDGVCDTCTYPGRATGFVDEDGDGMCDFAGHIRSNVQDASAEGSTSRAENTGVRGCGMGRGAGASNGWHAGLGCGRHTA